MFLNIKYNNERLYIGRCNHARRLRLHLGDDEDDTSHLQKGHKPRKNYRTYSKSGYGYEKDARILRATDDCCVSSVYICKTRCNTIKHAFVFVCVFCCDTYT